MNRVSLQRVSDKEVNTVLMQIQDALNALADAMTVSQSTTKAVTQLKSLVSAKLSAPVVSASGTPSLRYVLPADQWCAISFPVAARTILPNYTIKCYSTTDYNRRVDYRLQSVSITGFEIWVNEPVRMQLDTDEVITESTIASI